MHPLTKASLISGLTSFGISLICIFLDASFVTLLIITFLPGPVYGSILLLHSGKHSSFKILLFLLLVMAVYYSAIYWLDIHNYTDYFFPYKIIVSSVMAAILLNAGYAWLTDSFQVKRSLWGPAWLGVKASLLSTMAAFGLRFVGENEFFLFGIIAIGLLSIFPLWQYLFSIHLLKERGVADKDSTKFRVNFREP